MKSPNHNKTIESKTISLVFFLFHSQWCNDVDSMLFGLVIYSAFSPSMLKPWAFHHESSYEFCFPHEEREKKKISFVVNDSHKSAGGARQQYTKKKDRKMLE